MYTAYFVKDRLTITLPQLASDPALGYLTSDACNKGLVYGDLGISVADLAITFGLHHALYAARICLDDTHIWHQIALWLADTVMVAVQVKESIMALIGAHLIMRRYNAPRDDLRVFRDAAVRVLKNVDYKKARLPTPLRTLLSVCAQTIPIGVRNVS